MRKIDIYAVCVSCGKPLGDDDNHTRCPECRRRLKKEEEEKRHYNPNFHANEKLDADAVAAQKEGLSYGKYKMKQYLESLKRG